jgi:hypothetical protein
VLDGFALQGNESRAWQAVTGAVDTPVAAGVAVRKAHAAVNRVPVTHFPPMTAKKATNEAQHTLRR